MTKSPFELGEYTEITLKVHLPKDSKEHLGDASTIVKVVADRLNILYGKLVLTEHWSCDRIWFEPVVKHSVEESWLND